MILPYYPKSSPMHHNSLFCLFTNGIKVIGRWKYITLSKYKLLEIPYAFLDNSCEKLTLEYDTWLYVKIAMKITAYLEWSKCLFLRINKQFKASFSSETCLCNKIIRDKNMYEDVFNLLEYKNQIMSIFKTKEDITNKYASQGQLGFRIIGLLLLQQ